MVDENSFDTTPTGRYEDDGLPDLNEELVGEEYEQNRTRLIHEMTAKLHELDLDALEHIDWLLSVITDTNKMNSTEDASNG